MWFSFFLRLIRTLLHPLLQPLEAGNKDFPSTVAVIRESNMPKIRIVTLQNHARICKQRHEQNCSSDVFPNVAGAYDAIVIHLRAGRTGGRVPGGIPYSPEGARSIFAAFAPNPSPPPVDFPPLCPFELQRIIGKRWKTIKNLVTEIIDQRRKNEYETYIVRAGDIFTDRHGMQ
jgi:hypothetical protein